MSDNTNVVKPVSAESLLAEAKKRFPIGTQFIHKGKIRTVSRDTHTVYFEKNFICCGGTPQHEWGLGDQPSNPKIYVDGVWVEITSSLHEEAKKRGFVDGCKYKWVDKPHIEERIVKGPLYLTGDGGLADQQHNLICRNDGKTWPTIVKDEKPISTKLKVEDLIEGHIYKDSDDDDIRIIRFRSIESAKKINLYSQILINDKFYENTSDYTYYNLSHANNTEMYRLMMAEKSHR